MNKEKQPVKGRWMRGALAVLAVQGVLAWGEDGLVLGQTEVNEAAFITETQYEKHIRTSLSDKATDFSLSEETLVWLEPDGDGVKQVMVRIGLSGTARALTRGPAAKDAPYVQGDRIVWAEQAELGLNWDIYCYTLSTGKQQKLNEWPGQHSNPTVEGDQVVWFDRSLYGDMYHYDLRTNTQTRLGEGRFPRLSEGIVVYKHARDGGISLLSLSSGVQRPLVRLGGSHYVDWFVFNGKDCLWKQKDGAGQSQFIWMKVTDSTAKAQEITSMSFKQEEYAFMAIGSSQAVFMSNENGKAQLQGVDLTTGQTYSLEPLSAGWRWIGCNGDQLVYANAAGELATQPLMPSTDDKENSSNFKKNSSSNNTTASEETASAQIGAEGGQLHFGNGIGTLVFAAGTFVQESYIQVYPVVQEGMLLDVSGRTLESVGTSWRWESTEQPAQPATLTLKYELNGRWTEDDVQRLGMYRQDESSGHWVYVGGITRHNGYGQATVLNPGTYTIFLRHSVFSDLSGHWADEAIETLAARGIVEGMTSGRFEPDRLLTRAQFTKMLVGALGITPLAKAEASFTDVRSSAWHYGWIEAAHAAGIVQGDGQRFHPDEPLTREQMMNMLVRAAQHGQFAVKSKLTWNEADAVLNAFSDEKEVSQWARNGVAEAVSQQWIQGEQGRLHPQALSTRAEAATVLWRLLKDTWTTIHPTKH